MNKEKITFYGKTDMGRLRTNNEDAYVVEYLDPETVLAIAIDGVGGYEGGEVAAEIAQKEIPDYLKKFNRGERLELLKQAVVSANNSIYEHRLLDAARANMSCVLTAALIDTKRKVIDMVHVGDTRMYQFHHGELIKISHDHSLVGYREEIGDLSEEEAMHHPQRNVISREVGSERHEVEDPDFLEAEELPLLPNTTFLLCSDGLSDLITSKQIATILEQQFSLEAKVQKLIDAANEAGGKDNVTVVLAEYQAEEEVKPLVEDDNLPIEPEHETEDNIAENLMKTHMGNKPSKWIFVWQNRRKFLSIIIIVLSLVLICLGLSYLMIEKNILEESGAEVFKDIIENDNKLTIIGTIIKILLWSSGILSLCLVLQELFSIIKSKSYQITSAIHLSVIIAVLISFDLLLVYPKWEDIALGLLFVGFIVEVGLCIYEILLYVVKPVIKLNKSDFTSKQKLKAIINASFYALAYICGLVCSFVMIYNTICLIIEPSFKKYDAYGDVYYDYGPGGSDNVALLIIFYLLPLFFILSTFGMNIIHNVIEKKMKKEVSRTDELAKTQTKNEEPNLHIETNKTKKGCLVFTIVAMLIIALQIGVIVVWFNTGKTSNNEPVKDEVETVDEVVEEETDEEFDKMIRTLDSLGARQEHIDDVRVNSEDIN